MADGPLKMPKNDPVEKEAKKRIPHIPPIMVNKGVDYEMSKLRSRTGSWSGILS